MRSHWVYLVVVGYQKERVLEAIQKFSVKTVEQVQQLGTGHAVQQAVPMIQSHDPETLVLCGDMPLISLTTLNALMMEHRETKASATVLTTRLPDPASYGRIVRGEANEVLKIVEFKDASESQRQINEINSGTYLFETAALIPALGQLQSNNAQKEFYLTDTLEIIRNQNKRVSAFCTSKTHEVLGINTEEDLRALEQVLV
jgi:UDP-N-acetylglucosamine diphosphorylase/glucosamine-1-phosphate N-acetyltransferase